MCGGEWWRLGTHGSMAADFTFNMSLTLEPLEMRDEKPVAPEEQALPCKSMVEIQASDGLLSHCLSSMNGRQMCAGHSAAFPILLRVNSGTAAVWVICLCAISYEYL